MPLSYAQQRLWFLDRFEGPSPVYNIALAFSLSGDVDAAALASALADVTARHESLRTVLADVDGQPRQQVLDPAEAVPVLEPIHVKPEQEAQALAAAAARPFDLAAELPIRGQLLTTGHEQHQLLLLMHHIAADGWSVRPLLADLGTAYQARRSGHPPKWADLPAQYADYTLWQRDLLGQLSDPVSELARQAEFWRAALAGLPAELALPVDRQRPASPSYRGGTVAFTIPASLHARLSMLAREQRVTLFMIAQAALAVLLSGLGAGDDIPIGAPIAGRTDHAADDLVGFFVNTLVLRTDLTGNPTFTELLDRVRDADLAAFAHQDIPFELLVELLNPARSLTRHPLFQVMLEVDNTAGARLDLGPQVTAAEQPVTMPTAKFDLDITLAERTGDGAVPAGIDGELQYACDLFDHDTAAALAGRLVQVLAAVTADPGLPVSQVGLITAAEREVILTRWNESPPAPAVITFPDLFTAQAERTPAAPALQCAGRVLSYASLDAASNRLARYLIDQGAGPEQLVAIAMPPGELLITALLAVVKTGAAYLPIDPGYPSARIAYILGEARPACIITTTDVAGQLPVTKLAGHPGATEPGTAGLPVPADQTDWLPTAGPPLICADDPQLTAAVAGRPAGRITDADRRSPLHPGHLAYVIYTSGSTGTPKGVATSHLGLACLASGQLGQLGVTAGMRILSSALAVFDPSVSDLVLAFSAGATLILRPAGILAGQDLGNYLTEHQVNYLEITPRALALVPPGEYPALRVLNVSAEAWPTELLERWAPGRHMFNTYGPTESTVTTTMSSALSPAAHAGAPPIGLPISGTRVYVLDQWLRPVPPGVPGELYIAGLAWPAATSVRPG